MLFLGFGILMARRKFWERHSLSVRNQDTPSSTSKRVVFIDRQNCLWPDSYVSLSDLCQNDANALQRDPETGTTRYLKISSFNCLPFCLDTCIVTNNQSYIQSSVVHKQHEAVSRVKTPVYSQLHHYHLIFTTDMPHNGKVYECCIFFWVIPWCLNFMFRRFGTLCLSILIGRV